MPSEAKKFKRFPVCEAPAVISIPESVERLVVSTFKTLCPEPSSILKALAFDAAIVKSPIGEVVPIPMCPRLSI